MEENFNIYEEMKRMDAEMKWLKARVEKYEAYFVDEDRKAELDLEDDLEGFYTINEILVKYDISRQCFYNYRKLVPLKKSIKIGRFNRYTKRNINEFMCKIIELKETQPNLFKIDIKKAS